MNGNRAAVLMLLAMAVVVGAIVKPRPDPITRPEPVLEAPVPMQETTTADAGALLMRSVPGSLPPADPRQKGVACKESLGQFMIQGACWQLLPVPPPCPREDGAFEHSDRRCYVRVLRAEKTPTSGGEPHPGVASP